MNLEDRISVLVQDSVNTIMENVDQLMPQLINSAAVMANCLVNDNKVLCCGTGCHGLPAQLLCTQLLNRYQQERPSLPAISLAADAVTLTAIGNDNSYNDIFAKPVMALAQAGDVVVVVSGGRHISPDIRAIQAAHQRNASVVVISDHNGEDIAALLQTTDNCLLINANNSNRLLETQCVLINSICDLIDHQLFGSED